MNEATFATIAAAYGLDDATATFILGVFPDPATAAEYVTKAQGLSHEEAKALAQRLLYPLP
jgi:hypothetical protein